MKRLEAIIGETWRPVHGCPGYQVSDAGRCKRIGATGEFQIEGKLDRLGYRQFGLMIRPGVQRWFLAHRLIAAVFISPEEVQDGQFMTVNHKNRDKSDNRLDNLELVTVQDNHKHWRKFPLHSMLKTD